MSALLETRNADLADFRNLLEDQHARKIDVVTPATRMRFKDTQLVLHGNDPVLNEDGVTDVNGAYRPTEIFDEGIADKLDIPIRYVRRMRAERPDLYDFNLNGWLRGRSRIIDSKMTQVHPADSRNFLVRTFRGDDGEPGVARAILSDRYGVMDNLDALMAALAGIRDAGVDVKIDGCDLTDRRMYVRVRAPQVSALAPTLLANYRSPFSGNRGADNPTVFAGFVISNSETGGGAFQIVPRIIFEVCDNGMTITRDAMRAVHLGGKLDAGLIKWGEDTERKNMELVTAKARDSVRTFLDTDYVARVIANLQEDAEKPIANVEDVKVVSKKLMFDQETADSVFNFFVKSGDITAGGVMQAVTATAQTITNADKAHDMESSALRALELAAAL